MNAVILARVSSKEQEEGLSLDAQKERLIEYAKRRGMDVVEIFTLTESSTVRNRRKFQKVVQYLRRATASTALIADAVDRVQRTFSEIGLLDDLRKKKNIELHFYRENLVINNESTSQDIMRWEFAVLAAHSYVLALSENVKRSIGHKIRNGEISGHAPLGYMNVRTADGKSDIIIDSERAPYIKRIFEIYAKGNITPTVLAKMARGWGLTTRYTSKTITKNKILYILANRFYYGEYERDGTIYQLRYEPLISKELWESCEDIRLGRRRKRVHTGQLPFIYRGILRCANSGRLCTASIAKGRYTYLQARRPDGTILYVPEDDVNKQVANILDTLRRPPEYLSAAREILKGSKQSETQWREGELRRLNNELAKINERTDKLLNLLLDQRIDDATYNAKLELLRRDRATAENAIAGHKAGDENFNQTIVNLLLVAMGAGDIFLKSSNIQLRSTLLKLVFRTLELNELSVGYSLNFPFDKLQQTTELEEWGG